MKIQKEHEEFIRANHETLNVGQFARKFKLSRATVYGFMKRKGIPMKRERDFSVFKRDDYFAPEFFDPGARTNWLF
jgi:hypothetical protein